MSQQPHHGYLLLADISGYTSYLAGVELDHAQGILSDLLEIIVGRIRSLMTIGKLEGDAVFAYVDEVEVGRGETLLELVEATYFDFRDRREAVKRRTTCTCAACRAIPTLDLKFITHYGDYMIQNIAGISELVGSDVNLVHRLLKNHVAERTGWHAYALFTGSVLDHLVVPCDPRELHAHTETYEHLGDIMTYSLDLRGRYEAVTAARHVVVEDADADVIIDQDCSAPPAAVWDFLNDPTRRDQWMTGTHWTLEPRAKGRTGPGARNHCAHGKNEHVTEEVVDWKPFEYATVKQGPDPNSTLLMTFRLTPTADCRGTHLHITIRGSFKRMPRFAERLMTRMFMTQTHYPQMVGNLVRLVNQQAAAPAPNLSLASATN